MQPTGVLENSKATKNPLQELLSYGQSMWLDYIRRDILQDGELQRLINDDGLRGMTSNPAIFEKAIAGGWRTKGFHGPPHVFNVTKTDAKHPISDGLPAKFEHKIDELYQNSVMVPGNIVLATAYSDKDKPKGTGKEEPVIWVNTYGKGRVYENSMGHDLEAMSDPQFQEWMRRGVIWAGNGKMD